MYPASDHILHHLSDEARLWVIALDGDESGLQGLLARTRQFIEQWVSHGRPVQGAAMLGANRFLLVAGEVADGAISLAAALTRLCMRSRKLPRLKTVDYFHLC